MHTRYIVFEFGPTQVDAEALKRHPGVEIHRVESDDDIIMALAADLHSHLRIVCVGGDEAKRNAECMRVEWVLGGEGSAEEILRLWGFTERSV
jgi:hypothetical protein